MKQCLFTLTGWYVWLIHSLVVAGTLMFVLFFLTQWYGEDVTILLPKTARMK